MQRDELEAGREDITVDDVRSPEEAFFALSMEDCFVKYVRIPTTPERAPNQRFFVLVEMMLLGGDLISPKK